eukprot:TRINITY_DN7365_c0_g1_i1.p1 TRINITY_DN7365_c0_g1~~TRINITY_DN7365_c0_g1_i1.p1  ORF type:complete len:451 (+),score=45.37 TRINITY_DN7365_c0_g1_i1:313-1665(+)
MFVAFAQSPVRRDSPRIRMTKRVYQEWKGSNKFFLCGRLIFGPDVRSLAVTVFLIVVPTVIFCVFVGKDLIKRVHDHWGIAIIVVTAVYMVGLLVLLLLTSGRDPGILPRNTHPPEPEEELDNANSPAEWGGQTPRLRFPRTKDVIVNGVAVKTKYCDTCMLYRPPRCSHCSICNNCVQRFDHHCPWVGQCIGQRNYRFFFMFVSSTTLLCIFVFAMSAWNIKFHMTNGRNVWRALASAPASIVLMVYTFIAMWFVGGLTVFHLYLISTNQTTYENFRYRYDSKVNPYNRGVWQNFREIFFNNIEKSKNNFRAKVELEPTSGQILHSQVAESDMTPPRAGKASADLEMGKQSWPVPAEEVLDELHTRVSDVGDLSMEAKDGYDDTFGPGFGRVLSHENHDTRNAPHPRRSSWGRKSGSWEITPDILALTAGVGAEGSRTANGDSTPPGNR